VTLRFSLRWLRLVFNPPVVILLALLLGSLGLALGVSYCSLSTHLRDDYLWLDNEYVELGFPKNWLAISWIETEQDTGGGFYVQIAPPDANIFSAVIMMIYSERAT
jgi:hypothetical protein